jgi:hypothetical protein
VENFIFATSSATPPPHYLVGIRDKQAQVVKTNFQPEVLLMT